MTRGTGTVSTMSMLTLPIPPDTVPASTQLPPSHTTAYSFPSLTSTPYYPVNFFTRFPPIPSYTSSVPLPLHQSSTPSNISQITCYPSFTFHLSLQPLIISFHYIPSCLSGYTRLSSSYFIFTSYFSLPFSHPLLFPSYLLSTNSPSPLS